MKIHAAMISLEIQTYFSSKLADDCHRPPSQSTILNK